MSPRIAFLTCLALAATALATTARGDTVTLSGSDAGAGTIEITGEVVDYTGEAITISRPPAGERDYPASRVVAVDTAWPAGYTAGLDALAAANYAEAAQQLAAAARADRRGWVRRLAMQSLMQCYAAAGDPTTAGKLLVEIARSDPATPAFEHAPLAWHAATAVPPSVVSEWLASPTPAAKLLGASRALSGSDRATAVAALEQLATSGDPSLAPLAEMQLWRIELVTASAADVARWQARLRTFGEQLTPGGWLVVGDAYRQLKQTDNAALAYLRCEMLAGDRQPQLAAYALGRAADTLERAGQGGEARQLREQLVADYPKTDPARQGRAVLQSPE